MLRQKIMLRVPDNLELPVMSIRSRVGIHINLSSSWQWCQCDIVVTVHVCRYISLAELHIRSVGLYLCRSFDGAFNRINVDVTANLISHNTAYHLIVEHFHIYIQYATINRLIISINSVASDTQILALLYHWLQYSGLMFEPKGKTTLPYLF